MQRSFNFFKKKCEIKKQFILFLLTGVINTLFGYGIYALFIYLGVNYFFSSLISLFFGIIFNFLTIGKFVFGKLSFKRIKKFISYYMLLYIFYIALIKIFSLWQSNLYICGILSVMFMSVVSFMVNKYLIFVK
jgi:putative flippase GtrA